MKSVILIAADALRVTDAYSQGSEAIGALRLADGNNLYVRSRIIDGDVDVALDAADPTPSEIVLNSVPHPAEWNRERAERLPAERTQCPPPMSQRGESHESKSQFSDYVLMRENGALLPIVARYSHADKVWVSPRGAYLNAAKFTEWWPLPDGGTGTIWDVK